MRALRILSLLTVTIFLGASVRFARAQAPSVSADWRTYTDLDYGFRFSYPATWSVEVLFTDLYSDPTVNNKRIALRDETASLAYVSVWTLAEGQSLQEWMTVHRQHFYSENAKIPTSVNAVVAGTPAWFIVSPPEEQTPGVAASILQRGGRVYAIEYIARDKGAAQGDFARVLDSFAFSGQTVTPASLPTLPWFEFDATLLVQDCCGYHDGQPNPYTCVGGNCVWWAAFKRDDITTENLGNAMYWITNAPNYGFPVGKAPVAGAVVVYQPGVQWASSIGHVAYVESLSGSNPNNFTITEMSYGGSCNVNTRTSWVQDGVDFIYRKDTVVRPSYVDASDGTYPAKVSVTWNASAGATRYQVWRAATSSSAEAVKLADNILTASYDDATVTPGLLYYYWVIACNGSICTNFSSYNTGFASPALPPDPPPAPAASDGLHADRISVTWASVSAADRYEVWRGTAPGPAAAVLLDGSASNPYSDASAAPGVLYYYRVKACNPAGCSAFTPLDSGYVAGLGVPAGVSASDGEFADAVRVSFMSVSGALDYEVYRSATNDLGSATFLGAIAASPFQDETAESTGSYYYWVRAHNASETGPFSDPDSGSRAVVTLPGAFVKVSPANEASNQLSDLSLSWAESAGALSYEYCLDTLDDGACNAGWTNVGLNTSVSLSDLASTLTYYWQVRALGVEGLTYADGGSAAWWHFSSHAQCYVLHLAHSGSGVNPVASPTKSPVCAQAGTYVAGESISLSGALADPAWRIASWTGTNNNSATTATNTLTMPADHRTALVNYAPNCFALTVTKNGPGTVPTASPASSVGCSAGNYAPGEVVTLSGAAPSRGYYISSWTGTSNNSSTAATNTVFMSGNAHTAGVTYSPECYSLNFDYDPPGAGSVAIQYSDRCNSGAFPYDSVVTITASPASGIYRFLNWSGHATGTANPVQVTMVRDTVITAHFEQSTFVDVPFNHPQYAYIQALWDGGYTAGCSTDPRSFCPDTILNRAMSAVFILRGDFGADYSPSFGPEIIFADDWSPGDWAQVWAEAMWAEGLTAGCSAEAHLFCPWEQFPRVQASIFGLRLKYGASYIPLPATGTLLADVTPAYANWDWGGAWIEQAYLEGLLPACGSQGGKPLFCPDSLVNRAWAAYLIVQAKGLPLP